MTAVATEAADAGSFGTGWARSRSGSVTGWQLFLTAKLIDFSKRFLMGFLGIFRILGVDSTRLVVVFWNGAKRRGQESSASFARDSLRDADDCGAPWWQLGRRRAACQTEGHRCRTLVPTFLVRWTRVAGPLQPPRKVSPTLLVPLSLSFDLQGTLKLTL